VEQLTLRSNVFANTRTLRVLLPPGYHDPANRNVRYPVFYFLDGIAAFDAWGLPAAAEALWRERAIPPVLFVGVDNGGSTLETTNPARDRASEYLPYADESWTTADAPRPRGDLLPSFLFEEVMPLINSRYRADPAPSATGLAGDSFAGAAAIYTAINHPDRIGLLLAESPSLHIGRGRLLSEAKRAANWPGAVYLGVGTEEGATPEIQAEMLENVRALHAALRVLKPAIRVHLELTPGGAHSYDAWHRRLPAALRWLLGPRHGP
jgi:enterochelin esterase-like enzyme